VDDGDRSTRKLLGKGCQQPNELDARRHAPPGSSVSHENSKLLSGLTIDAAITPACPEQAGLPKHGALDADEHSLLRRRGRRGAEPGGGRDDGAEPDQLSSSLSFHRS
jgi:hypothetical protein